MTSGVKRGLEELALPPKARARLEGSCLEERLVGLEGEFSGLPEGQCDYLLVKRVESIREEYLNYNVAYRFTQAVASFFVSNTTTRIEGLYSRILQRHNLPHEYHRQCDLLVEQALANRDLNRLIFLNRYMSPDIRGRAVEAAASKGHLDIVQALVANGSINEAARCRAVGAAASGAHLEIVSALLVDHEHLRGKVVTEAAHGRRLEIVEALLAGRPYLRGTLIVEAARGGHLEVVRALLANGAMIADQERGMAVYHAAENGYEDILCELLASGPIHIQDRGRAVEAGASGGHLKIVQALLEHGGIWIDNRGRAVEAATSKGHLKIVQVLLEHGDIGEDYRGRAVEVATSGGHLKIVQALLEQGTVSERFIREAVRKAASGGHLEIVRALLVNHEHLCGVAFREAARNGHLKILETLLVIGGISEADINFALRFAQESNQEAIKVFLQSALLFILTRFLDPRLIPQQALGLLAQDDDDIKIPAGINFETVFEWAHQINWVDRHSPYYMSSQRSPEGDEIHHGNLRGLIQIALERVTSRDAVVGAPPAGSRELGIFYDKLEYKIKIYMQKLLEDEAKLNEKIAGRSYENLDESTQRELRCLCETKARFCIQLGISGQHCAVRLNNEVSQLWSERFAAVSSEDELLSLEDHLKKLFGFARLNIAKEKIALIGADTHVFGAYMQSLGLAFRIPGAKNEIEHLHRFSESALVSYAQQFAAEYTPAHLLKEMQNFYKEEKNQAFREKILTWLQDNVGEWNQAVYDRLFAELQTSIAKKLQELDGSVIAGHRATDLFLDILKAIDPAVNVTLENEATVSLAELPRMLRNKEITLDEFKRCVLSLKIAQDKIATSVFVQPGKNPIFAKVNFLRELNELGCDGALEKLAMAFASKDQELELQANMELQQAITRNHRITAIQQLIRAHGLTGVDCHNFKDLEAFDRSLKAAIINKQKSDYLQSCLGEGESLELPSHVAESILVSLGFLRQA